MATSAERKHTLEILDALNNAIEKGSWEGNLFFQAMAKKLGDVRERFKQEVHLVDATLDRVIPKSLAERVAKRTGLLEVYVLLYNANGSSIPKWEAILSTISSHVISRPIYRNEHEAKEALRAATNKLNEGYVAAFIGEDDVLKPAPDRIPYDRRGTELLVLREGAIKRENISRFVHKSGNYECENHRLIWQSVVDFL